MENKQHVQLPNGMTSDESINPQDLLIYVAIKRFMNKDTKEAFPSLATISQKSGASIPTIRKSIKKLQGTYFEVIKKGRSQYYKFDQKYQNFEPFSYDFLDKEDLTFTEKAYIIASQQYMYKDEPGIGKITLSSQDLSKRINMPESTISKCNKSLTAKDYLSIVKCTKCDSETGVTIQEKIFHLDELGQAVIWALHNHEQRISNNEKTLDLALKRISQLETELSELKGQKLQDVNL